MSRIDHNFTDLGRIIFIKTMNYGDSRDSGPMEPRDLTLAGAIDLAQEQEGLKSEIGNDTFITKTPP